jgi:predicted phage terminase large subunit-like protein
MSEIELSYPVSPPVFKNLSPPILTLEDQWLRGFVDALDPDRRTASAGGAAAPSLRDFVGIVNPRYQWYRHCALLCDALEDVVSGVNPRLMVFMPPRHGKSELISRLFSAYYLYRHPDRWVGLNSYADALANTFSRSARDNYLRAGGKLRADASATHHWQTPEGGGFWAAGVGGPITGKGFHLGIIDDPLKNAEEAQSVTIREKHKDWYASTFYTRMEPGAAIVIVQTRWHEDDLSGHILASDAEESEAWHVINLPAIADADMPTFPAGCTVASDWRAAGQALCPERYPIERLQKIEAKIGVYFFSALFQQSPRAREGNMFKLKDLRIVPAAPVEGRRVRYWDLGGSDSNTADFSAGVLMNAAPDGLFYIEDVERGQWSPKERNARIRATAEKDQERYGSVTTWIERVPGLAVEVIDAIVRLMAGLPVHTEMAKKDKVTRADPLADQCEAGNVRVVKADWNAAYRDELCAFPNGKKDDQVDGSSGAFSKVAAIQNVKVHTPPRTPNRFKEGM